MTEEEKKTCGNCGCFKEFKYAQLLVDGWCLGTPYGPVNKDHFCHAWEPKKKEIKNE